LHEFLDETFCFCICGQICEQSHLLRENWYCYKVLKKLNDLEESLMLKLMVFKIEASCRFYVIDKWLMMVFQEFMETFSGGRIKLKFMKVWSSSRWFLVRVGHVKIPPGLQRYILSFSNSNLLPFFVKCLVYNLVLCQRILVFHNWRKIKWKSFFRKSFVPKIDVF
jgi:hypothetical protein